MSETSSLSVKGHCPHCGPNRTANIVGSHTCEYDYEDVGIWGKHHYRLLVCRGCENPYLQIEEVSSEQLGERANPHTGEREQYLVSNFTYWPSPLRRERPTWFDGLLGIDKILISLINDVYGALNADLAVPAAIAARTAFDRAAELLSIDPALTFEKKLKSLVEIGKISDDEQASLGVLTDAGSAAVHRGWRPKPRELDLIVSLLEVFLHRSFILDKAAHELKPLIPAKPKPQKSRNTNTG